MIEVSIKGLDERISKLLSKSFRVTDDAEISIAWIRDEEDIEKNPSKVIVESPSGENLVTLPPLRIGIPSISFSPRSKSTVSVIP